MSRDFSQFKKEITKDNSTFEFKLDEAKEAKVYKAKMTNRELLLIHEASTKEFESEVDRTIEFFNIFLGKEDGLEVFNSLTPAGIEEVLLELFSELSGTPKEELQEVVEESLNSPSE